MIDAITHQWNKLHADYTAAHHDYMRLRMQREDRILGGNGDLGMHEGLSAHLAAKGRLASAQRAMHEFCQKHAEIA
jgi:hypothetical protein